MTDTNPRVADVWERDGQALRQIFAAMADAGVAEKLSEVLGARLVGAAQAMGLEHQIDTILLNEAAEGQRGFVERMAGRLQEYLSTISSRKRIILERRIIAIKPETLQSLGSRMDLTRERVRQLQANLKREIRRFFGRSALAEVRTLAQLVRLDLSSIVTPDVMTKRLDAVLKGRNDLAARTIRCLLIEWMGFVLEEGVFVDSNVEAGTAEIKTLAREVSDDAGLVEEEVFLGKVAEVEPAWIEHWEWLCDRCGLRKIHGCLAIRDSGKAKAKAALLSIGRPATKREVGALCGLTERQVGGAFSNIESVVRADRTRWGLKDWIDDEYDGIVGEIIQRIQEDGGATTTSRLLEEIPSTFDVSPSSVRAYMQTPLFEIREGTIRIADTSTLRLRDLDDVIDGRNAGGEPYWTFRVEERYLRGYSAIGVPPEFLKALGCEPDKSIHVGIENVAGGHQLSARWPLASTTGGSLGYLARPLKALDLRPGDRVRVTLKAPGTVALERHKGDSGATSRNDAQDFLNRMIARRRSL